MKRKLILIALCCLCAFGLSAQDYNKLVEEAMACAQQDSLVRAEQLFRGGSTPRMHVMPCFSPIWAPC